MFTKPARTFGQNHTTGRLGIKDLENSILCGDCSDWLDRIPDNSLDMVYIDPPFFTRSAYEVIWGNGWEKVAWEDWKNSTKGDIDSFINYMSFRLTKIRDKLKDSGTIWVHCDHRANYRFRSSLEEIFGGNFVSEIIVQTTYSGRDQAIGIGRQHETILVFSKTARFYLNNKYISEKIPRSYKYEDHRGRYSSGPLTQDGAGPARSFDGRSIEPPKGYHWIWPQNRINKAIDNYKNDILDTSQEFIFFTSNGVPRIRKYLKKGPKVATLTTLWDDCIKNSWTEDAIKYPTKKSGRLLERVVNAGCPPKGIMADLFCGGGTSLLAAAYLGRRFIGCDVSPVAMKATMRRFKSAELSPPRLLGMPRSKESYLSMNSKSDKHAFEIFLCDLCGWNWLDDRSGQGKGFDAFITGPNQHKIGAQIKNWRTSVGVKELRELAGSLNHSPYQEAILVAWELSSAGFAELSKIRRHTKVDFVKIEDLLECFLISKEKEKELHDLLKTALAKSDDGSITDEEITNAHITLKRVKETKLRISKQ